MPIATVDPTTGETLKTFDALTPDELEQRLQRAADAFARYRRTSFAERAAWMRAAADKLDADTEGLARLMTTEMGKTVAAAKAEIGKCAKGCRFYAEHAERFLSDEPVDPDAVGAVRAHARYQPLGPVLAVMPWNFPLWQAMRFAAPALMAGNVGLLKHASNVPQTALYLEELFREAGFPEGVFTTLLVGSGEVEGIIRDPRVAAVTLTGSTPAGRAVASVAGDALKKSVLELGGSDPFVVLPSADLAKAATVAATARCQNNGQSCIAAKRFIVHADVADEFERLFAEALSALVVGDPAEDDTDVGPLATEQGRDDVEELVQDAVGKGARVVVGGQRPDRPGWYYPPTLLTGVTPEMRMFREEVFGPVAQLHVVPDLDAAIALANDTDFGLGANVWTGDRDEADRFTDEVQAGMVAVNGMVASFPDLPFGGVKDSGYGRELSAHGIREFCNVKSVWVGEGGPDTSTSRAE
ncbi:MAG TPA: NADP-dependent succinic semialdehyde dehydrogenase [Mycobacteriales bacterium]|nr:NADP-dependent succinic semialdehyde dehydrogenase [Mycobacteriales bacterium]